MPTNQYEIPAWGTATDRLLGWCLEARQEGAAWLAAQRPATTWEGAVSLMEEADRTAESTLMSNTVYPKSKRIARELVASLSAFQHEGEFQPVWSNDLYDQAHILTDLDANWYLTALPRQNNPHRAGLQQAVVKGTGYWMETWDKHFWGPHKGDIRLTALDPSDVTFVQLPRDRDIQRAYAVIIRYELPINLAKRMYAESNPGFAQGLVPDQESPSWLEKGLQKVQQFLSPALRVAGRTRQNASGSFPTVNIYHMYTADASINNGFDPIEMGIKGTNWAYQVPSLGSEIPTGMTNPATGQEWTRPAMPSDCLLFPLRRLTIFSSTGVAYDNSSSEWHGDVPIARVWFNDWPWEALGGSLVSDVRSIEGGINALMRAMEDSAAARLDPPAIYDDSLVSKSWAQAVNPRMAGVRAAAPLSQGNPITYPVPPGQYDVPNWIPEFIRAQEDRMDYITGARDMVAIAKANQIPSADTLEKLMEMAGPIVQDLVRAVGDPLISLGEWRKSLYFQYYNSARIIRTVGPDVPFDPGEYTADRLAAYFDTEQGKALADRYGKNEATSLLKTGAYQFRETMLAPMAPGTLPSARSAQMKRLISEFRYEVTESGINEIHRMTTKLFYLQLMKESFPISPWTMAKVARVPNFGPPPEHTNTEMERWVAWQHMKIELQGDLQKELAESMPQQPSPGGADQGGGEPQPIPHIGEENRGRPQSYQRPPRLVQKSGGTRSTVTTS